MMHAMPVDLSRTDEMFQHLLEPATAVNMIVFRAFGLFRGCVTLRGEFEVRVVCGGYMCTGRTAG